MLLFNASDPSNVSVTQIVVPGNITGDGFAVSGNQLFTADGSNLIIYNIGQSQQTLVKAQLTIPTNNGVAVDPNSFNLAPTKITTGPDSETLEWDLAFTAGYTDQTITWKSLVSHLQPGEARTVVEDATVDFTTTDVNSTSVNIDPQINNFLADSVPGEFPTGGSVIQVGGVDFTLAHYPNTTNLGVAVTADATPATPSVLDFPVNVANPTRVYTLINSFYGAPGTLLGTIEFIGTGGAQASFDLVEGMNVRDFNNGVFVNTVSQALPSISFAGGQGRLDRQSFDLPASFLGQTLTEIRLTGIAGALAGRPFLAAATVVSATAGTPGMLGLPDQVVAGQQIIGLSPATQTVAPAAPAGYTVNLVNPTSQAITYQLAVQGVAPNWVSLATSVTIAAGGTANVPLTLLSDSFAAEADYSFSVTATAGGATGSVVGDLLLQGPAVPVDAQSHGVVVTLAPQSATAGQGTSASYTVQVINTGSDTDTFGISITGLPTGVTAQFFQSGQIVTTIDVPPGASNFRSVTLVLTSAVGTTAAAYPFQVVATSTTKPGITAQASGFLNVLAAGVSVSLDHSSTNPGGFFLLTVTNKSSATDTFDLRLAGPAALVAHLQSAQVTLAAGSFHQRADRYRRSRFRRPGRTIAHGHRGLAQSTRCHRLGRRHSDHRSDRRLIGQPDSCLANSRPAGKGHLHPVGLQHR